VRSLSDIFRKNRSASLIILRTLALVYPVLKSKSMHNSLCRRMPLLIDIPIDMSSPSINLRSALPRTLNSPKPSRLVLRRGPSCCPRVRRLSHFVLCQR
jgi:hypothetical protein